MKAKVSIIMATYNRAHFIAETLRSIQNQTFNNWECLIIDDGGSDNTEEIINPILEKDIRFQFLKRPITYVKGIPGCRNYGLDLAQADFVIFFDDDDIVHPDLLRISINIIDNKKVDFCHFQKQSFERILPDFEKTDTTFQQILNKTKMFEVITQEIGLASCTVLWYRACFDKIRFNENLLYAEEWECYSKIISEGFEGIIIGNVLYFNRKHPNSNTGEFYSNNSIRRKSKSDAVLLVVENLKRKQLLSHKIFRYFIQMGLSFKEYNLFADILNIAELSVVEKLKWRLFYSFLPLRLYLYGLKKKLLV